MNTATRAPLGSISRQAPQAPVKVRYCLYARKSTESEERQVLSIDSQIKEMLQLAEREGLEIVGGPPERFLTSIRRDIDIWKRVVREAKISVTD